MEEMEAFLLNLCWIWILGGLNELIVQKPKKLTRIAKVELYPASVSSVTLFGIILKCFFVVS